MKLNQVLWTCCTGLFCSAALANSPPNYRVTILPAVDGALSTRARALNDSGEIAGDTFLGGNILIHVIYWASPDAAPIEMTGFGADTALARDINSAIRREILDFCARVLATISIYCPEFQFELVGLTSCYTCRELLSERRPS